jgi:hypothetical protein
MYFIVRGTNKNDKKILAPLKKIEITIFRLALLVLSEIDSWKYFLIIIIYKDLSYFKELYCKK